VVIDDDQGSTRWGGVPDVSYRQHMTADSELDVGDSALEPVRGEPEPTSEFGDEEAAADRRASAIAAGRRKGGVAGAAMAGAMLALSEIYEGPRRDEIVATAESPGEPGDIDKDGIEVRVGDVDVWAPPPNSSPNTSR
jgi:hypothetical protein